MVSDHDFLLDFCLKALFYRIILRVSESKNHQEYVWEED